MYDYSRLHFSALNFRPRYFSRPSVFIIDALVIAAVIFYTIYSVA